MTNRLDFIIIANAWSAGRDNPTSKHRIALELARRGHRVLWVEGSGMRTPSMGSGHDRLRMARKVVAAFRGVRRETVVGCKVAELPEKKELSSCSVAQLLSASQDSPGELSSCSVAKLLSASPEGSLPSSTQQPNNSTTDLWVLSPLFIPLPRYEFVRRLNGLICRWSLRFWGWRLGFRDPVLINYVPVLAEAMRGWRRCSPQSSGCQVAELRSEDTVPKQSTTEQLNNPATSPRAPRAVYHCVDRWDQFGMYASAMMAEMDRRCCVYADLVMASSTELYERCRQLNPKTIMIAHGVDWEHFREAVSGKRETEVATDVPAVAELRGGECVRRDVERHLEKEEGAGECVSLPACCRPPTAPIIGFFGLLSEWVDQDLILRLAKEFPQATILLIGKADVEVTRLQGVPNIQLAGPKPFAELPSHIARFTVGIIPFVVNDLTRAVNPIKLREMLAAGCPVVSTALPEVEKYVSPESGVLSRESGVRSAVCVAHDVEEFVAGVRACLEHPLSIEERRAISDSMAGETWSGKVDEILRLVG